MTNSRLVGLGFLMISAAYLWFAGDIPLDFWSEQEAFNARSMPYLIGSAGVLVSLLLVILPSPAYDWQSLRSLNVGPALMLLALLTLYGFLFELLGFIVSTNGFLALGMMCLGERRWFMACLIAVLVTCGFWFLMSLLDIYLNPGEWFLS